MRFRYLLIFLFYGISHVIYGDDPEQDTIRLEGVTITGSFYERYSAGSEIQRIDSARKWTFASYNLNDLVRAQAPIHFKSYGSGMLSSVSFRGTGAGHTALLWNGINVNQPTIGQSDFSLFPVVAFDRIKIHYGATSSRYGSETIGGALLMDSRADWSVDRFKGSAHIYGGSCGRFQTSGEVTLKPTGHILSSTRFYRNVLENNFRYKNITKPGNPVERQKNASVFQYGLIQDLYLKPSEYSQLSLNTWFNYADRDIQPSMSNDDSHDSQKDKSFRVAADYQQESRIGFIETKIGYLWDYLLYNRQSEIQTGQWIGQVAYENNIDPWIFRTGVNYNHITAISENYETNQKENRSHVYGGIVYTGFPFLELSLNVRKPFISGYRAPIAPSFGGRYDIILSEGSKLRLDGQMSMNYRIPTLNDRYWQPGGRPDLQPERSQNLEGTMVYHFKGKNQFQFSLTGFHYRVKDWILWIPGGNYWIPDNVRKVNASGIEIKSSLILPLGLSRLEFHGFYSLTRSIIRQSDSDLPEDIGNQLPYTPVHLAGFHVDWSDKNWKTSAMVNYTGKTYITTDNEASLSGYSLVNLQVSRNLRFNRQLISVEIRVDNLFNKDYQNVIYRAMPGRTYLAGIHFFFNS
jgi:vitamin B12 transporter